MSDYGDDGGGDFGAGECVFLAAAHTQELSLTRLVQGVR
jgi:hypothetical protein